MARASARGSRDAIFNRDYPVLQGGILFIAIMFVLVNLVVDISYAIINPRIRYSVSVAAAREPRKSPSRTAPSGLWREAWARLRRNPARSSASSSWSSSSSVAIFAPAARAARPARPEPELVENGMLPGAVGRALVRRRHAGPRRVLAHPLRRALLAARRRRVGRGRPLGRDRARRDRRLPRRLGRHALIMRLMDMMLAIPGLLLAIGDRRRARPGPRGRSWSRSASTKIPIFARLLRGSVLAQKRERLRARGAVGRRAPARDPRRPHPPELDLAGDRAGNARARDCDHRRRRPRLPRPRRPGSGAPGVGRDADRARTHYLQSAPWLAIVPGLAIVVSALGFNLIGDGAPRGARPEAPWP